MIALASCQEKKVDFDVIEQKVYDVPAKTQYTERLVLKSDLTGDEISHFLNNRVIKAIEKQYKYRSTPSHIYIYAYKSKEDFERNGSDWVGMVSRENGVDNEPQIK